MHSPITELGYGETALLHAPISELDYVNTCRTWPTCVTLSATMTKTYTLSARVDRGQADALAAFAGTYGRSVGAELRLAIEAHTHAHALWALTNDPETIAHVGGMEIAERMAEQSRALLDDVYTRAFKRPRPADLMRRQAPLN